MSIIASEMIQPSAQRGRDTQRRTSTRVAPIVAAPAPPMRAAAGLCTTCGVQSTCTWWGRHAEPVWHCEEFDAGVSVDEAARSARVAATTHQVSPRRNPAPTGQQSLGLCVNCELVDSCKLPRPASGVWHCEEYI